MTEAPAIKLNSTRGLILMWVCTDPPRTWTAAGMVSELQSMGTPRRTAHGAIDALRARGLLSEPRYFGRAHDTLAATSSGYAAIRAHLPDSELNSDYWPGGGPWVPVAGKGTLNEEQYAEHLKGSDDE
jgi:hypothetical protein